MMSEAGYISLANTFATFVLSIFILWTRWSLNRYELSQRERHGEEVLKLDDIRKDIKEGVIAKKVADLVADQMRIELAQTLSEALTLMSHHVTATPIHGGPHTPPPGCELCPNCTDPVCLSAHQCKNFKVK